MHMQQWDIEDVETVAGVVRLLCRAAQMSWTQADAGARSPHQLFALGIDAAADEAANLVPPPEPAGRAHAGGRNPAELLGSAEQLLRRLSTADPMSPLRALHFRVAELVWEANSVPTRDRRTVGALLADSDSLSREALLDLSADQSAAMVGTWGQVVDAAAGLWAVMPSAVPVRRSEPDLMPGLRQMAIGIAATTSAGHWPGPGPHRRTTASDSSQSVARQNPGRALWRGCATHHGRSASRHRRRPGKDHAHLVRGRPRHRSGDHRTHQRPPKPAPD